MGPALNDEDVAVLVLKEGTTDADIADAVVELASDWGLLEGRDPNVLRRYLLSDEGKAWLKQRQVGVRVSTLKENGGVSTNACRGS